MSSEDPLSFRLECPDCDVKKKTQTYETASKFAQKHQQHTGHKMDWVRTNFDTDLGTKSAWEVSCGVCEKTWTFETQENAENHRDEHRKYTDHEITNEPNKVTTNRFNVDQISPHTIKELISAIGDEYEDGAPEIAVVGVMSEHDQDEEEVRSMIEKLRTKGEVYEPKRGHLRTT